MADIEDLSPFCHYSQTLTSGHERGVSQAFLYGIGMKEENMKRPFVGISSCWIEGNPCNAHLNDLAARCKASVEAAGLNGLRFNTISISDALSMGTKGMRYSLLSREVIADSIETVMSCLYYDANISIPSCDKNMPGVLIALARLNRPSLIIYGGSTLHGNYGDERLDAQSIAELYGHYVKGLVTDETRLQKIKAAIPCSGACPGMFTANTMSVAIEAMGMSLPGYASAPAVSTDKLSECDRAGAAIFNLIKKDIKSLDIMTRDAFENSITAVCAAGGSTNAVLHLLAVAKTAGVPLCLDDFGEISDRTPYLLNLRPSGKYLMQDLHGAGGTGIFLKHLLDNGYLKGDCITVTGSTMAQNLAHYPSLENLKQDVIFDATKPIKTKGNLKILRGNIAVDGAVAKLTGYEGDRFVGPAVVFDDERDVVAAIAQGKLSSGNVVVVRYEGPRNGMPEMLVITAAIIGAGLRCALITDGRFSGSSHGFIVGHISPEAYAGGNIALLNNGDEIVIDAISGELCAPGVTDAEWTRRRSAWTCPPLKVKHGVLRKFARAVSSASTGCLTDQD